VSIHVSQNSAYWSFENDSRKPWDVVYASVTAPDIVLCQVFVDNELIEAVYVGAGGSHSWWTNGGGKFFPPDVLPNGLPPGSTLGVSVSGPAAFRIDWYDRE
jgi:hypothetical protein